MTHRVFFPPATNLATDTDLYALNSAFEVTVLSVALLVWQLSTKMTSKRGVTIEHDCERVFVVQSGFAVRKLRYTFYQILQLKSRIRKEIEVLPYAAPQPESKCGPTVQHKVLWRGRELFSERPLRFMEDVEI
jgi:hypothetical protein